jgi:predicted ATPase
MNINLEIENFKSIKKTQINLKEGLNILIGPNGSGKTCILNSLKFLRDLLFSGAGIAMAKGGGNKRVYHRRKRFIAFNLEFAYGKRVVKNRKREVTCKWEIRIEQKTPENIAVIVFEKISLYSLYNDKLTEIFSIDISRANIQSQKFKYNLNLPFFGKDLFSHINREGSSASKNKVYSAFTNKMKRIQNDYKSLNDKSVFLFLFPDDRKFLELYTLFANLNEYNIIPERARQATDQIPYARMDSNGYGIAEVISALIKKNYNKIPSVNSFEFPDDTILRYYSHVYYFEINPFFSQKKRNLENALDNINKELAAAVHPISSVGVKIDDTTGKKFVVFKSKKEEFYPDEVSDGTIKWLCILTSIFLGYSNIYLLEEPENFLHPWMQQKLVEIMREQANQNKTIFLLTTHSTTLLNSSLIDEVLLVKQSKESTDIHEIKDKNEVKNFLENSDFKLGDLWVSGGIGAIPE